MNIVGKRKLWFLISTLLVIFSMGILVFNTVARGKPMNFGIDFTGGTMLHLRFNQPIKVAQVRAVLTDNGLGDAVIQRSKDRNVFIRSEMMESDLRIKLVKELGQKYGGVELLEVDSIGPVIGKELRIHAIWALLIASIGIIIYVSFRFEFVYALAALVALFHDAIIAAGFMALLWRNIDVAFVAGILTIMGYSINDSIVIFDRIRENLKKYGTSKKKFAEIVNRSLLETLGRSINTVLTSLAMVLALLFFGGETLKNFSLVLLVGFVAGAYSSIFLASQLIIVWQSRK